MSTTANIIRFRPDGANGLEEWEQMEYAALVSGEPVQRGHLYHEIEAEGYMAGVWDCTAFVDQMMPYPVDEYMLFLKGGLSMVLPDGEEIKINAGDAFIIPKGFVCQWSQPELVHKYFMILDGPVHEADNRSLKRITVPDLSAPSEAPDVMSRRTDFLNAAGTMRVEVVSCSNLKIPPSPAKAHQMISVLSGSLTLHYGNTVHQFNAGETAYLHQGDAAGWETTAGTHMIVASYASPA